MYKESRFANGLIRLVTVLSVFIFLYGELFVVGQTYKPLDIVDMFLYTVIWAGLVYIGWFLLIYIINGFRTKMKRSDKS